MLNVNNTTKNKYRQSSNDKQISITIYTDTPITLTNVDITSESMQLIESMCTEDSIEFVGCISTQFSITVHNLTEDVKGKAISVTIKSGTTETINLFHGYVETVELTGVRREKRITAYDILHKWQETDVAEWYKNLSYPITLGDFRDSLFDELGIEQEEISLPMDSVSISRRYNPTKMSAIEVIKSLCQINCVFGRINRDGNFEYIVPSSERGTEVIPYYKSTNYQEYTVKPVDKLVIQFGEEIGVYGAGFNTYTIQNNIFMNGFTSTNLQSFAQTLYPYISSFVYRPFEAVINGLPYLECLDSVIMEVEDIATTEKQTLTFKILNRSIKGCQALYDSLEAEGIEYQREFVTDLNLSIEELKRIVEVLKEDMNDLKVKYYLATNTEDVTVADQETKTVIDIDFQATKDTLVVFQAEMLCDTETTVSGIDYDDARLEVTYKLNNVEITDYYPTQTWQDGKHILHLFKTINASDGTMQNLKVLITMDGGSISIPTNNLHGCLYGQNLFATEEWDGTLEITETIADFVLPTLSFSAMTDTVRTEFT